MPLRFPERSVTYLETAPGPYLIIFPKDDAELVTLCTPLWEILTNNIRFVGPFITEVAAQLFLARIGWESRIHMIIQINAPVERTRQIRYNPDLERFD